MALNNPIPDAGSAKGTVERKTRSATIATFLIAFAGLFGQALTDTDFINSLPDALEVPVYAAVAAGGVFLSAYKTKHQAGKLSLSALRAAANSRTR